MAKGRENSTAGISPAQVKEQFAMAMTLPHPQSQLATHDLVFHVPVELVLLARG